MRVILEMSYDPKAVSGDPRIEAVTLEDTSVMEIHHAPQVAIRPDLAAAIAATRATLETAYENLIQVTVPAEGFAALSRIPGVRLVRLPYPAAS